jgi:hypothetical protein
LNFTDYSRQKNPVQNGKEIQFIKLHISNRRFAKNKSSKKCPWPKVKKF